MHRKTLNFCHFALCLLTFMQFPLTQAGIVHRRGPLQYQHPHCPHVLYEHPDGAVNVVSHDHQDIAVRGASPTSIDAESVTKDVERVEGLFTVLQGEFSDLLSTIKDLLRDVEKLLAGLSQASPNGRPEPKSTEAVFSDKRPTSTVTRDALTTAFGTESPAKTFVVLPTLYSTEGMSSAETEVNPPGSPAFRKSPVPFQSMLSDTCSGKLVTPISTFLQESQETISTSTADLLSQKPTLRHGFSTNLRTMSTASSTSETPNSADTSLSFKTVQSSAGSALTEESRILTSPPAAAMSRATTVSITSTVTVARTSTITTSPPVLETSIAVPTESISILNTYSSVAKAFNPLATNNIAVYYGQTPPTTANGLLTLCANPSITIVNLAFLSTFFGPNGYPSTSFGPACSSSQNAFQASEAPGLQNCTYLGRQIRSCQQRYGKKIFVSLGGYIASSSFQSSSAAVAFASTLWNLFGAGNGTGNPSSISTSQNTQLRPFGAGAIVDGFDIDNEDYDTSHWIDFARALRAHFTSAEATKSGKQYYLSSTPQCPRPDASIPVDVMQLSDFVNIQFYNNPDCNFDAGAKFLDSVVAWAGDLSNATSADDAVEARRLGGQKARRPAIIPHTGFGLRRPGFTMPKLFIGIPGWPGAGSGYVPSDGVGAIISRLKKRLAKVGAGGILGGIMMWDGPEALENIDAQGVDFLDAVALALE